MNIIATSDVNVEEKSPTEIEYDKQVESEKPKLRGRAPGGKNPWKPKQRNTEPYKALCWNSGSNVPYTTRFVFDIYCDFWFKKIRPTVAKLMARTGCRRHTIEETIKVLRGENLIIDNVPQYSEKYFKAKRNQFSLKKWFNGCNFRPIVPLMGDKFDLLHAHILYRNDKYPDKYISAKYLATSTGMHISTVQRLIVHLVSKNKILRDKSGHLTALVDYQGTMVTWKTFKDKAIMEMTIDCMNIEHKMTLQKLGMEKFNLLKKVYQSGCQNGKPNYTQMISTLRSGNMI